MSRSVLLVDQDAETARALAAVLRRTGALVHVARSRTQALNVLRRLRFELAIVDLFLDGGGVELARELARQIPQVVLSMGAALPEEDVIEAALGFPVHRKATLAGLTTGPDASSSDGASAARLLAAPPPCRGASGPARVPIAHVRGRSRRSH